MQRLLPALLGVSFCVSSVALAASTPSETNILNKYVGNWRCAPADAGNSDSGAVVSTERLPGDWYVSWVLAFHNHESEKKVAKIRYDAARNRYVLFIFGEDGSYGYGLAESPQDDGLTFKGEYFAADGTNSKFTKAFALSEDGYTVDWSVEGDTKQDHHVKCTH